MGSARRRDREALPQHSMGRALALRGLGSYMRRIIVVRRQLAGTRWPGSTHMDIDRRLALAVVAAIAVGGAVDLPRAQNVSAFDPVATARLRAGEIAREIAASGRDASVPEPSRDDIFNTGLLLQAGLRALLPVQERQGIALPGTPSPSDPIELIAAQENYKAVFES